jgi:hypothetical protein
MTAQLLTLAAGIDVGQRFLDVGFAPRARRSEFPTLPRRLREAPPKAPKKAGGPGDGHRKT